MRTAPVWQYVPDRICDKNKDIYTLQDLCHGNGTDKTCYKDFPNKGKRDLAKERYEKALTQKTASLSQSRAERP